ncbi:MAG: ribosome maturation factor RimM [Microbacteriaceae bacterium]|jgi:16S rRNA processing protein RimM|nr:ribosome maturation factor RimM [Microbacteriaceae bacterium]
MTSAKRPESGLRVGRLLKAHGLKGAIKLELYTDDPALRFVPGSVYTLQVPDESPWVGKTITLKELKWYNDQAVVFLDGIDDRDAAESLVKAILWVDEDQDSRPVEEDAWYDYQLIGLTVRRNGHAVGTISRVDHFPSQDLLIVDTGDAEVLVPFVKAIVTGVDIEAGTMDIDPPIGLFEDPVDDEPESAGA